MNINLVCCLFILDKEISDNIRKDDVKKIKILVNRSNLLPSVTFKGEDNLKEVIQGHISSIINSNIFHLEQVFTTGDSKYFDGKNVDVIYLGVTNIDNVKNLSNDYKLIDFSVTDNKIINFDDDVYEYKTIEKISNQNIEYFHDIHVDDIKLEKILLEVLIAYKRLRTKIDNSDIIFKFMGKEFTLEDVRNVYEMIKGVHVDKSNFRKRIVKYVEKVEDKIDNKGHRPTQLYCFKPLKNDIWL